MEKYDQDIELLVDLVKIMHSKTWSVELIQEETVKNHKKIKEVIANVTALEEIKCQGALSTTQFIGGFIRSLCDPNSVIAHDNAKKMGYESKPLNLGNKLVIVTSGSFPHPEEFTGKHDLGKLDILRLMGVSFKFPNVKSYKMPEDGILITTVLCDTKNLWYKSIKLDETRKPLFKDRLIKSINYLAKEPKDTEIVTISNKTAEIIKEWQSEKLINKDILVTSYRSSKIEHRPTLILLGSPNLSKLAFNLEAFDASRNMEKVILNEQESKLAETLQHWNQQAILVDTISQINPSFIYALGMTADRFTYLVIERPEGSTVALSRKEFLLKDAILLQFPSIDASPLMFKLASMLLENPEGETWADLNDLPYFVKLVTSAYDYLQEKHTIVDYSETKGNVTYLTDKTKNNVRGYVDHVDPEVLSRKKECTTKKTLRILHEHEDTLKKCALNIGKTDKGKETIKKNPECKLPYYY